MSIEHKLIRRDDPNGDQLIITITGAQDIYRFAHHMLLGQVEFADRARKILLAVKRRLGNRWAPLDRSLGGWKIRGEREPNAAPDEEQHR